MLRVDSPNQNGTHGTGRIVAVSITLDEPVVVEGEPALALATDPPRNASYAGGSGTSTLEFLYAVQPGDSAPRLGYAGDDALALPGGATIRDPAGNAANLTLPVPGQNGSLAAYADIEVHGAVVPVLAEAASSGGASGSRGVKAFELGGRTYAAVASEGGNGVQLVRVHDNGSLSVADWIGDTDSRYLQGAISVDALTVGGNTYIVAVSYTEHGVQVIGVNSTGGLSNVTRASHDWPDFRLGAPLGVASFDASGSKYIIVTSGWAPGVPHGETARQGRGVDVIRVNASGGLEHVQWYGRWNVLTGASGVDVFEMPVNSTHTAAHAIVAAANDNCVQLFRIYDNNGTLDPIRPPLCKSGNTELALAGAISVDAFRTENNRTYAIVASSSDDGVQLIRVHGNGTLEAAGQLRDSPRDDLALDGAFAVKAFAMGNRTYAAVASENDDGVQLIRVHEEDGTLSAVGVVGDGPGFPRLNGARGIDVFETGNHTYAIVTSTHDGGVQLIRLSPASATSASASLPGGTAYTEGISLNVTVGFDAPVSVSDPPPSLPLRLGEGGAVRDAKYLAGSGTDSLVFNYTVQHGDGTGPGGLRYADAGILSLRGAVADANGTGLSNIPVYPPGDVYMKLDAGRGPAAASLALPDAGAPGPPAYLRNILFDAVPPRVVNVTEHDPKGATYARDDTVRIAVAFDEAVVLSGPAQSPSPSLRLALDGDGIATALFDRLSGDGRTLFFSYTVGAEDAAERLDYDGVADALSPGGRTMADEFGNRADLALPAVGRGTLGELSGIKVDGIAPVVESVTSNKDDARPYTIGAEIDVRVRFSEAVVVDNSTGTPPSVPLETGNPNGAAAYYASGNGSRTIVFNYTVSQGDNAADLDHADSLLFNDGNITDLPGNTAARGLPDAGNDRRLAESKDIEIDTRPPSVERAEAELSDRIRVTFDGPVWSGAASASDGWSLSGPDAGDLSPANPPIPLDEAVDNIVFVLDGHLPDTAPDIALSYTAGSGAIADEAGNLLQDVAGMNVTDRVQPRIDEALITGPRAVRIDYTEPVTASQGAYSSLDIGGDVREIGPHSIASAISQHALVFLGAEAPIPEPPSSIAIDETAILDAADPVQNPLGNGTRTVPVYDGRVLEAFSPRITGPDTAEISYTRHAAAERTAYSSLVVAGQNRTITGLAGGGAVGHVHTLTFSPGGAPPNATGTVDVDGTAVLSGSDMRLGNGTVPLDLADGQLPDAIRATAVSRDTIRVEFDEAVAAPGTGAEGWSISGRDAPPGLAVASSQDVNASDPSYSLELTLSGMLLDTAPDATTLSYRPAEGGVADPAGNRLVASARHVFDGIAPLVDFAHIEVPRTAVITYTEPVRAAPGAYVSVSLDSGGEPRPVTGLEGNGMDTHRIAFGGAAAEPGATGSLALDVSAVVDAAGNPLADRSPLSLTVAPQPSMRSATAVSLDTIRVEFDKPVSSPGTGAAGWSVSGGDAEGISVESSQDVQAESPSEFLEITLGSDLPDTAPDDIVISYDPAAGGNVADSAGHAPKEASSVEVADGIIPAIASAFVSGPNAAEVRYTEPVRAGADAYASVVLSSGGGLRAVAAVEGNGTMEHTVAFEGEAAAPGATGALGVDENALRDAAMNPLGTDGMRQVPLDGRAPPAAPAAGDDTASVKSAVFTARNEATIVYSDALGPPAGHDGAVYSVAIYGEDRDRTVAGIEGLGTRMHTIAFGGAAVDRGQNGTITLAVGLEGTAADGSEARIGAGTTIPVAPGAAAHAVLVLPRQDGMPDPVVIERDGFARIVDATQSGDSAHLAINVSGLAAPGAAAPGTAVFPGEPVTLSASFAEVTFPPGITAESVPADGVIALRVSAAAERPSDADVARFLSYEGAGGLELHPIIIEAGSDRAPIVFDKPVRILLAGQAMGRAFYIDGSADAPNATIVPIDRACAADDAQRVHVQLRGSGECQLDSGGDKVVYTYHMTRFGTAASERGTPPPDVRTCSLRLAWADLRTTVAPGDRSEAAVQRVVNSGSEPFDAVELDATPWYVGPASDAPGPNATSLPANSTVMSLDGTAGSFVPLPASGTEVAQGLGGGRDVQMHFMLDLTGRDLPVGSELVQRITYTAACGARSGQ